MDLPPLTAEVHGKPTVQLAAGADGASRRRSAATPLYGLADPMSVEQRFLPGVFGAIFDDLGRLLCVKQNYGDGRWTLPGGGIEAGETVVAALQREVLEETGLEVEPDALIGSYSRADSGAHVVLIRCKVTGGSFIQSTEEIADSGYFYQQDLPTPFGPGGRAWTRDAFSQELGFVRVFNPAAREYE